MNEEITPRPQPEEEQPASTNTGNEANPEEVKQGLFIVFTGVWKFLQEHLSIRGGTDIPGSIEGIKKDIEFKGHSVWILISSIFIASIGLNTNSTAVIIGAMLISPLMGPILGVGLAVGTNDTKLLRRALINFAFMVGISLLTSFVYFMASPLGEEVGEILARTKPTLLDAFIAIFGGVAGIIAGSRKEKSNVIPGVAIATALMPPLCTAGFGLASGHFEYFFGAMYLFLLNCIFISIATFTVVRYLQFPLAQTIDQKTSQKINRWIVIFVMIVIIPSGWLFIDVVKESLFRTRAQQFISQNFDFKGTNVVNTKLTFNDSTRLIEVFALGEILEEHVIDNLESRLLNYELDKTKLVVHQSIDETDRIAGQLEHQIKEGILEEILENNVRTVEQKDKYIAKLEREIFYLKEDTIPFIQLTKELSIQYPEIKKIAYASAIESHESSLDTIPTFLINWKKPNADKKALLVNYLEVRLNLDTVRVIDIK